MNDTFLQIRTKAAPLFAAEENALFAYLFGSQASGKGSKNSDADVAVYMSETLDPYEAFWRAMGIAGALQEEIQKTVEMVVLNEASILLKFEAIRHGKLMYSRDDAKRHIFEVRTMDEYADVKPMYELQRRYMVEQIKGGEFIGKSRDLAASVEKARRISRHIKRLQREH